MWVLLPAGLIQQLRAAKQLPHVGDKKALPPLASKPSTSWGETVHARAAVQSNNVCAVCASKQLSLSMPQLPSRQVPEPFIVLGNFVCHSIALDSRHSTQQGDCCSIAPTPLYCQCIVCTLASGCGVCLCYAVSTAACTIIHCRHMCSSIKVWS